MQLIAGALSGQSLSDLNLLHTPLATVVKVAVAYAGNDCMELFKTAEESRVGLNYYGRYDATVAVSPAVISWFLERAYIPNLRCRLVCDFYHPKVIWWVGRGVYIGSANLTSRAWTRNIEVGTFISEEEIQASLWDIKLDRLFDEIHSRSHAVTPSYLKHVLELVKMNKELNEELAKVKAKFEFMRFFPKGEGLVTLGKKSSREKAQEKFQNDRLKALELLWNLQPLVTSSRYRPQWMPATAPPGVQIDQFLYAYHKQFSRSFAAASNVEKSYEANKLRKDAALMDALEWWHEGNYVFDDMAAMVTSKAPRIRELFAKDKILKLDFEEFAEAWSEIHAVRQYVMNRPNAEMNLPPEQTLETKLRRHCEMLWLKRSPQGKSPLETLNYVFWGSDAENIETRIWNGSQSESWALPWTRESSLSDALGWARPDDFPPINGRSEKALRALGNDVEAHL